MIVQNRRGRPETIDYVRSMLKELQELSRAENCDMLAYLIEMAHIEASDFVRDARPSTVRAGNGHRAA